MSAVETKVLRYGTTLMPTVVKGIVGSFPGGPVLPFSSVYEKQFTGVNIEGSERRIVTVPSPSSRYPSVSTILGCTQSYRELWFWQLRMIKQLGSLARLHRYMRERVTIGLRFHATVKGLLSLHARGALMDKTEEDICKQHDEPIANYVKSVLPLLRSFDPTNEIVVEQFVIHPQLYYYGRFDAIIRYKDAFYLVDFKTTTTASLKDGNDLNQLYSGPIQVAAYIGAANCAPSLASKSTIRKGAIIVVKENGSTADLVEINLTQLEKYWQRWLVRVQKFWYEIETRPTTNGAVSFTYDGRKKT